MAIFISQEAYKFGVIDPDPQTLNSVSIGVNMRWPACSVFTMGQGTKGVEMVETVLPQLVITEIDLPDIDGYEVIRRIRLFSDVPIIVLSTHQDEMAVVKALELGADDYVVKPPDTLALLSRIQAVMRRYAGYSARHEDLPPFTAGSLVIDFAARQLFVDGEYVHVTPLEYRILCRLVRNEGRVVAIDALRRRFSDGENVTSPETLRKSMCTLRQKLGECPDNGLIINERGIGYRFVGPNHLSPQNDEITLIR